MIHTTKYACALRDKVCITVIGVVALCAMCQAQSAPFTTSKAEPMSVPTFHCLSVYWSPQQGDAEKQVSIKFREADHRAWRSGLPMRYNPVKTPECKADYRGSIVNLQPGTLYEVSLHLEGTEIRSRFKAATWQEHFPITAVVAGQSRDSTLNITQSGTSQGYVLYEASTAPMKFGVNAQFVPSGTKKE